MSGPETEGKEAGNPSGTAPESTLGNAHELSRRDFLRRAAGASAIALTGVGLAAALLDKNGPPASDAGTSAKGLGDYSLAELRGKPGRMAIVRGVVGGNPQAATPDRRAMLERALAAL
ncbi:MAG: hypothetical protein Q7I92_13895, partial [Humidesulfovibrio sp.]|nr:hypothetical protein [Humidesulfovibrio sp.]